ncbi:T9SS type A sorting domain-containing protein [Yeosuana sp. MJ-SS3]|uniref:T9SS type A sorting domain-containing protein n=1 Tax=Gilvirhabdus luticola TaxID=3079858 RepID=A0ABU3U5A4_9FLAO|nr:T9SS type A sorting domain-containing protein [Yeosuana sp. MJ-SS3]MDU8885506.1 T9SS type A sorting domain-containing protein [Yeosuana sp. MJ-SS3]
MKNNYNFKKSIIVFICILSGFVSFAQVDMVAAVDVTPPVTNGQTFNYTLETVSTGTVYNAVRVLITYNPSVIQVNSFIPSGAFNLVLVNDISVPGEIRYEAAKTGSNFNDTRAVFSAEFEVLDETQNIVIVNDTNPTDGAFVSNPGGNQVLGTTNDIDFSTLSVSNKVFRDSLIVYPNPARGELFIKVNSQLSSKIESLKIYSIEGKLIESRNQLTAIQGEIAIDISRLRSAFYFMTVTAEDARQATYKILVK